jgi:steroid 5-alpha reductase family enzyme
MIVQLTDILWPLAIILPLFFATLWWILSKNQKYEIVDAFWCWTLGSCAIYCAIKFEGFLPRRILLAVLALFWALRLGGYLFWGRVKKGLSDGRYKHWIKESGDQSKLFMFGFFQIQALSILALTLTFAAVCQTTHLWSFFDILGILLFIIALTGEWKADKTLNDFRLNPNNKKQVCDLGLWNYSRHPNYFFEWLHWCSYLLLTGFYMPQIALALTGPIIMLLLITKVSGIPLTEAQTLRSRGDAYRKYQQTTPAFFPNPFRKDPSYDRPR